MSDILIVGHAPLSDDGQEFFLHSTDWWFEILHVIEDLFSDRFPVNNLFSRDHDFAPPTPHLDADLSYELSLLLFEGIENGKARASLNRSYREDPILVNYFEGDEDQIDASLDERMKHLEEFAQFLKQCGGCSARWSWQRED